MLDVEDVPRSGGRCRGRCGKSDVPHPRDLLLVRAIDTEVFLAVVLAADLVCIDHALAARTTHLFRLRFLLGVKHHGSSPFIECSRRLPRARLAHAPTFQNGVPSKPPPSGAGSSGAKSASGESGAS